MNVKNTMYCVIIILNNLPNFDLKNGLVGLEYFFLRMVNTARKIPCKPPQIRKFQDAPCHKPINNMVNSILENTAILERLWLKTRG